MVEIIPVKGAKKEWLDVGYSENDEWIRLYIFLKKRNESYQEQRPQVIHYIGEIIKKLEKMRILKSFHFLYEPFPDIELIKKFPNKFPERLINRTEFKYNDRYHDTIMDVRIWIKITYFLRFFAKWIIRREFRKKELEDIADYGFWLFQKNHSNYDTRPGSKLYYSLICRIYELFCRFQFEKINTENVGNLGKDFNEHKIVHCFINSLGTDEAAFALIRFMDAINISEGLELNKEIKLIIDSKCIWQGKFLKND